MEADAEVEVEVVLEGKLTGVEGWEKAEGREAEGEVEPELVGGGHDLPD